MHSGQNFCTGTKGFVYSLRTWWSRGVIVKVAQFSSDPKQIPLAEESYDLCVVLCDKFSSNVTTLLALIISLDPLLSESVGVPCCPDVSKRVKIEKKSRV